MRLIADDRFGWQGVAVLDESLEFLNVEFVNVRKSGDRVGNTFMAETRVVDVLVLNQGDVPFCTTT
jgi:hypothetical protein